MGTPWIKVVAQNVQLQKNEQLTKIVFYLFGKQQIESAALTFFLQKI